MDQDKRERTENEKRILAGRFDLFVDPLICDLTAAEAELLLFDVRREALTTKDEHGLMKQERYKTPEEVRAILDLSSTERTKFLAAAEILQLGELEAMVEGLPTPLEEWEELTRKIEQVFDLEEAKLYSKESDIALSKNALLRHARSYKIELEREISYARKSAENPEDLVYIENLTSSVATHTFHLAWNLVAALGKGHELLAKIGQKHDGNAQEGGFAKRRVFETENRKLIEFTQQLIREGMTASEAADRMVERFGGKKNTRQKFFYTQQKKLLDPALQRPKIL